MIGIKSITLAIACLTHLHLIEASTTVEHPKLEFPDKELIFSGESLKNGKLTLALCTKNKETKERQCTVMREKSPDSDETKNCDIKIKVAHRGDASDMDKDEMKVFPLGENKAVLYIIDQSKNGYVQFNIVDLESCKVATDEMSLTDPTSFKDNMIIVRYKEAFDVYVYNHKTGGKYYVLKFGSDGVKEDRTLKLTNAETFSSDVGLIGSISGSPDKGLIYMELAKGNEKNHQLEFKIRKTDGSDISLSKQVLHAPVFLSTNDDLISMCFKIQDSNSNFNCTQHNLNGEEKFNVNPLKDDVKSSVVGLRNLPDGGMLIVVGTCEADICSFHEVVFSVIKVDSKGTIVGAAKIGNVKAVSNTNDVEMAVTFHTNKDKNNCISIANFEGIGTGRRNGGLLGGSTYCLADADFTK